MNGPISGFLDSLDDELHTSSLEDLFEEEPVALDVFVHDKKFLGNPELSAKQFELVQQVERVYLPSMYPVLASEFGGYWDEVAPLDMKNLITAEWGKGGGKDHTIRMGALRVVYLLLCLKSPQVYFAMPEQDSIHLLNVAVNAGQANRAFFKPMTQAVKRGWFADKADPKQDTILFAKNIEAISGHSDAESQEGLNLILGVADEIDGFKARAEMVGQGKKMREASTSAESILNMIKTSASTRFPLNYKRVAISYPRYLGSTIQRLRKEAEDDISEVGPTSIYFASGPYATWEVNPRVSGPEAFASDYRKDPAEAAAKYECKPSRATNVYFRNPQIFRQSVVSPVQPLTVEYTLAEFTSDVTGKTVRGWEPVFHFSPEFRPIAGARYVLHGDLAIKGDRAGVALSHVKKWEERETVVVAEDGEHIPQVDVVPYVHNDFTITFEADLGAEPVREIQIRWLRQLAYELIKRGFYIGMVSCDGFQSADTLQQLSLHGLEAQRVSTDIDSSIWKTLKDIASENRLTMPWNELLQIELEGLNQIGNKIDHMVGSSKDAADAFACSIAGAILVGGTEESDDQFLVGEEAFDTGEALAPLFGLDEGSFEPIGMSQGAWIGG